MSVLMALSFHFQGQKAPSTRRCIKTPSERLDDSYDVTSESTQHQKVH